MLKVFAVAAVTTAVICGSAYADTNSGAYAGGQIGYHDTGTISGISVDGMTYGGYAGFHHRMPGSWVVGLEGNYSLSSGDLDSEYGFNAHAGIAMGKSALLFARAGYQWVNFDLVHIAEAGLGRALTPPELAVVGAGDDTDGGFLVGAGLQFGLNSHASVRATVDTIEFDTIKVSAGVALHF